MWKELKRASAWLDRRWKLFALLFLFVLLVSYEGPPPAAMETGVDGIVTDLRFDFLAWEARTLWMKFTNWLLQPQRYMEEADRSALFREYIGLMAQIRRLEWQIEQVYADPDVEDPFAQSAALREELEQTRSAAADRQIIAESIVEEQIGTVLSEEGLGILGRPFPAVGIHFTPLPYLLVISPRERIEPIYQAELAHGLEVDQQVAIEGTIDETFDVSSLVTGIGGLSAWPAMILEVPVADWVLEVSAHEWTHHYLELRPLGWAYSESSTARTINETTASIMGTEVGWSVLARYYPDLLPPPPEEDGAEDNESPSSEPPAFDFRAEMRETRVEVDRLLAEGMVEEAEAYMEARREVFWENGYRSIRKLNQAYFAFHGSYADGPGASGEDPVGPMVLALRERSGSLRDFLSRVAFITTMEELEAALSGTPE
jgi:hypothetical protein